MAQSVIGLKLAFSEFAFLLLLSSLDHKFAQPHTHHNHFNK